MAKRSDLREKKTGPFYMTGVVSACLLLWVCLGVWSIQGQPPYPEAEPAEGVVAASDCANAASGKLPDTLQSELRIHQFSGWGVEKLGSANASGKRVWIIDSGVSLKHPDLVVDTLLSRNFVNQDSTRPAEDDNGHGTMIAGIIAAKDNDFGVKGIAAGATVVALKVLNSRAKGSYTDLINGIRYATLHAHPGEVAVICLGGPTWKKLDDAVLELAEKGVYVVISAGNHSSFANEYSPARVKHRNIYVVAGIDQHYNVLPKSNFGTPPITHCAPGKEILSTSLNGTYSQDSGSSMAAPHVAGMLLINDGKINSEPRAFCLYDQQNFYPVVKR